MKGENELLADESADELRCQILEKVCDLSVEELRECLVKLKVICQEPL